MDNATCIANISSMGGMGSPAPHHVRPFSRWGMDGSVPVIAGPNETTVYPEFKVFGPVDDPSAFYEYQLSRWGLIPSIQKFQKRVGSRAPSVPNTPPTPTTPPTPNTPQTIAREGVRGDIRPPFSIDPPGCRDFDDAVAVERMGDGAVTISVYIANVPETLERLGLWGDLTDRVATAYMPDKVHPMLPRKLSEDLCSLVEQKSRAVFAMDLDVVDGTVVGVRFACRDIIVRRNHEYDSPELGRDEDYKLLFGVVGDMNARDATLREPDGTTVVIEDSHQVVEYLMRRMNEEVGRRLYGYGTGIFRRMGTGWIPGQPTAVDAVRAGYIGYNELHAANTSTGDRTTDRLVPYAQTTSPIRRMCDLANMALLQIHLQLADYSPETIECIGNLLDTIPLFDARMRRLRRVQNDGVLMERGTALLGEVVFGTVVGGRELPPDPFTGGGPSPQVGVLTTTCGSSIPPQNFPFGGSGGLGPQISVSVPRLNAILHVRVRADIDISVNSVHRFVVCRFDKLNSAYKKIMLSHCTE